MRMLRFGHMMINDLPIWHVWWHMDGGIEEQRNTTSKLKEFVCLIYG